MNSTDGSFIPVKSRGKRRNGVGGRGGGICLEKVDSSQSSNNSNSKDSSTCLTNEAVIRKLRTAEEHLNQSGFISHFEELVMKSLQLLDPLQTPSYPKPSKIICFGLGVFSDCVIARYQLALLVALQKILDIRDVELFDPIFFNQEEEILQELGFHVLKENEEGKRSVEDLTIFYLPHCSHQLVNNVLFANWEMEKLRNCVVISNSFKNIHNSLPPRLLSQSLSFIARLDDTICEEFEIDNSFGYSDVFNDTAIHVFPISKISDNTDDLFWSDRLTPVYDDSDFVKNEMEPNANKSTADL